MKNYLKIEKKSVPWLFAIVALPLLVAALDQFNVINLTPYLASTLVIFMAMFVFTELGFRLSKSGFRLGKSPFRIFGLLVTAVAFLLAVLSLLGVYFAIFESIQGVLSILLMVYVIGVAFTK